MINPLLYTPRRSVPIYGQEAHTLNVLLGRLTGSTK